MVMEANNMLIQINFNLRIFLVSYLRIDSHNFIEFKSALYSPVTRAQLENHLWLFIGKSFTTLLRNDAAPAIC